MNVLIADDEKIVLEGLKYIIDWNRLGFTICQTACDGQDAFEKIKSLNPDLVLLDIRMPKMTGIEVVQAAVESGYTGKFERCYGFQTCSDRHALRCRFLPHKANR